MLKAPQTEVPSWTFLTNHAQVLVAISRDPDLRQSDVAYAVGITVGAVQRIVHDLEADGYIELEKVGRRNHYKVIDSKPMRHPLENQHSVGDLLKSLDQ